MIGLIRKSYFTYGEYLGEYGGKHAPAIVRYADVVDVIAR